MGDSSIAASDIMAAPSRLEDSIEVEHTPSSIESTPEQEAVPLDAQNEQSSLPQKRKGGRKPIYATSEERKQRNRQAQAAFRERRTEYIKQLEATIKQNDETLATLQQSHRSAADECLMLRYKNSLLERILLEKGINVQSELQIKTGSPTFGPNFMHPATSIPHIQQPQPGLQRAAIHRQHARRSGQTFMGKDNVITASSPQGQPTPPSHASSPTAMSSHRSPGDMQQHPPNGVTPPASSVLAQPRQQQFQFARSQQQPNHATGNQQQQQSPQPYNFGTVCQSASNQFGGLPNHSSMNSAQVFGQSTNGGPTASYYTSPFQKHIDQLELEYDTQQHSSSLLEQADADHLANAHSDPDQSHAPFDQQPPPPAPGSNEYYQHPQPGTAQQQQQLTPSTQYSQISLQPTTSQSGGRGSADFQAMAQLIDPNDPMLDADPFGLSASMHYPTAYSFDQISQR